MKMKKVVFIAICVLGLISLASCRSTSKNCGLADNLSTDQTSNQDSEEMLFI